jgi:hypothetical protein
LSGYCTCDRSRSCSDADLLELKTCLVGSAAGWWVWLESHIATCPVKPSAGDGSGSIRSLISNVSGRVSVGELNSTRVQSEKRWGSGPPRRRYRDKSCPTCGGCWIGVEIQIETCTAGPPMPIGSASKSKSKSSTKRTFVWWACLAEDEMQVRPDLKLGLGPGRHRKQNRNVSGRGSYGGGVWCEVND